MLAGMAGKGERWGRGKVLTVVANGIRELCGNLGTTVSESEKEQS